MCLDAENLRASPAATPAGLREFGPVVFPVARDAREQTGICRRPLGTLQAYAASVHQADFADWISWTRNIAALIEEIQQSSRQRKHGVILCRHGFGIIHQLKYLGARVHSVNRAG